jgi:ubiquinone/menaquinone biosynthesis C-methylase UbiE
MSATVDQRHEPVRLAYDRIASDYERQVSGDVWMRRALWRHYAGVFRAGDRVLDVACGTGLDAIFLARMGVRVTAIDISEGMIEQLKARVASEGLADAISARQLDVAELSLLPAESFDGITSAFAGLNTAPDLPRFARDAATLLRPGGRMVLHLLNRFSLWEWLLFAVHGDWSAARALGRTAERDFTIGGVVVRHHLYEAIPLYRSVFAESFHLERAYSLGSLRPPHDLHVTAQAIVGGLEALERQLGSRRPLLNRGRFFVLDLTKRPGGGHDH